MEFTLLMVMYDSEQQIPTPYIVGGANAYQVGLAIEDYTLTDEDGEPRYVQDNGELLKALQARGYKVTRLGTKSRPIVMLDMYEGVEVIDNTQVE